jgi:hypothetical protein
VETGATGWIVCEGATRPVVDALVECPRLGPVSVVECLGCRLMVTTSAERTKRSFCVADPDSDPVFREPAGVLPAHGQDEGGVTSLG